MEWRELYSDRRSRPGSEELYAFWSEETGRLFQEFSKYLTRECRIQCAPAVYRKGDGWTFQFGKSNMYLFTGIKIEKDGFLVEDILVRDQESLNCVLARTDELWQNGFSEQLEAHCKRKSREQAERARLRREREKQEREQLEAGIDKDKFNRFRWSPKLSRKTLRKLYESDAARVFDEELADEVGYTLYVRCLQGRDEMAYMELGKIKCHNCGEIIQAEAGLTTCSCGYQYLYRDYRRSFRTNNMPSNSAAPIFNKFVDEWPRKQSYHEKMQLIDWLIHEFHYNLVTGVKGRFVAVNLIEGTKAQIGELILQLAYGENYQAGKAEFIRNLEHR